MMLIVMVLVFTRVVNDKKLTNIELWTNSGIKVDVADMLDNTDLVCICHVDSKEFFNFSLSMWADVKRADENWCTSLLHGSNVGLIEYGNGCCGAL